MAEIALRAYVKEIEDLVENDQIDEAIAHSRHLLQSHPKHLDTYRLLGKAYLEAKRYGDSADIFQRVLSAVPDDFISHIGMSIVREDEGNMDDAIWHMERAFETNPSNPAIQKELRRLIGKRDGIEPHKVRLTRGALARMYAHGELYPQGIAELQAALQEDPNRPDLEVLLSRLHWRLDQRIEAAEVASRILEKLPFCLEANRILAAVLQADDRSEEATTYLRRFAALEPYAAFLETAMDDPAKVDGNSIRLEKVDWRPGQPLPDVTQPQWAASLGLELREEDEQEEPTPAWLQSITESANNDEEQAEEPAKEPSPESEELEKADIPGWMREAGWGETEGDVQEEPVVFSDQEMKDLESEESDEEGIEPADIPDWLKGIAPAEVSEPASAAPFEDIDDYDELPDWLSDIAEEAGEEAAAVGAAAAGAGGEIASGTGFDIPPWLEEAKPGATESIATWLGEKAREEMEAESKPEPAPEPEFPEPGEVIEPAAEPEPPAPEVVEPEYEAEAPEAIEAAPSWLSDVAKAAAREVEPPGVTPTELPEEEPWDSTPETEEEPEILPLGETPDWIHEITEPAPVDDSQPVEDIESRFPFELTEVGETPDWLDALGSDDEEAPIEEAPAEQEPPDWLREFEEETATLEGPAVEEPEEEVVPAAPAEVGAAVPAEELAAEVTEAAPSMEDLPLEPAAEFPLEPPDEEIDWLGDLEAERGLELEEEPVLEETPSSIQELEGEAPDWLTELIGEEEPEVTPLERYEPLDEPLDPGEAEELEPAPRGAPAPLPDLETQWFEEELVEPVEEARPAAPSEPVLEPEAPVEEDIEIAPTDLPPSVEGLPPLDEVPTPEVEEAPTEIEVEARPDLEPPAAEPPEPVLEPEIAEMMEEIPAEERVAPVPPAEFEPEREEPVPAAIEPPEHVPTKPKSPLESAREALGAGDIDLAIEEYGKVKEKRLLTTVIEDLQDAVRKRPSTPELWQALGDALMKADRVPEAIEAYRRGLVSV